MIDLESVKISLNDPNSYISRDMELEIIDRAITAEAKLKEYKEDYKWCLNEFAGDEPMTEGALRLKQALLATERAVTAEKAVDDMAFFIAGLSCPRGIIEIDPDCSEVDCKECIKDYFMKKARDAE